MGKNKNKQKRNPPKNGFQSAHAPAADTNRNNREEPNMSFATESGPENVVTIKVVGVGGAGNNVVNRMVKSGTQGIEYVAVNTDKQALAVSSADQKIQIGEKLTHGQGAGSDPDVGKRSAEESRNNIAKSLENADMVFITAGMGGGTGTGAAPTIADIAREAGILTVGVVTKPFKFEGKRRMDQAMVGINELLGKVDSLLIIPNDRLKFATDQKVTLANAFEIADDVLRQAVVSISDLIKNTGFINLDFADVTCVMKDAGFAHMGVGRAAGKGKAEDAARMAVAPSWRRPSTVRAACSSTSLALRIWAWRMSRRPQTSFRRLRTRTPTSSSVRASIPRSTTRSACPSLPPASTSRARRRQSRLPPLRRRPPLPASTRPRRPLPRLLLRLRPRPLRRRRLRPLPRLRTLPRPRRKIRSTASSRSSIPSNSTFFDQNRLRSCEGGFCIPTEEAAA